MELARWTEAEQVARLGRLARTALAAWGLADARVDPIKYRENAVFRADSGGRRFVLRVHRAGYRSDAHIRSEAAWVAELGRAGVETPDFVPTRGGDVLAVASHADVPGPRQCDLLTWVEGRPLGSLERGVALNDAALAACYRTVGGIAARHEACAAAWRPPASFSRPRWDVETLVGERPTFGRFDRLPQLEPGQRRALLEARERVREELTALGAPDVLIHGDLIPDNLLVDARGVRVIDFDDCGWSWPVFELATSVFPLLVSRGFEAGLRGYLEGYRAVRPFPEAQVRHLPAVLLARGLSYLGWPGARPEIHSQQALVPFMAKELCALAAHHLAGRS